MVPSPNGRRWNEVAESKSCWKCCFDYRACLYCTFSPEVRKLPYRHWPFLELGWEGMGIWVGSSSNCWATALGIAQLWVPSALHGLQQAFHIWDTPLHIHQPPITGSAVCLRDTATACIFSGPEVPPRITSSLAPLPDIQLMPKGCRDTTSLMCRRTTWPPTLIL